MSNNQPAFLPTQDQLDKAQANDALLGLPLGTTARQISQESGWNPNAVSDTGAMGYAQVEPETLASIEEQTGRKLDPSNFDDSLFIQQYVMGQNLRHFGNVPDALRAYNAGWDKSKWNNDETNGYLQKILGPAAGLSNLPAKQSTLGQLSGMEANAAPVFKNAIDAMSGNSEELDAFLSAGGLGMENTASQESADVAAEQSQMAGIWDTAKESWGWNTVIGGLVDLAKDQQEGYDPNFWTKDRLDALSSQQPQIWANDDLREYVQGAGTEAEAQRRIERANERAEWLQHYQNAEGMLGAADSAAAFLAPLVDPVAIAATAATGGIVNVARAAVAMRALEASAEAAGMSAADLAAASSVRASLLQSAATGAAANAGLDAGVRALNNQHTSWNELFAAGVAGAAFGTMGHLFEVRGTPELKDMQPLADAGLDAAGGIVDRAAAGHPADATVGKGWPGGPDDMPAPWPESTPIRTNAAEIAALEAEREGLLPVAANVAEPGSVAAAEARIAELRKNVPGAADMKASGASLAKAGSRRPAQEAREGVQDQIQDDYAEIDRLKQHIESNRQASQARQRLSQIEERLAELRRQEVRGEGSVIPETKLVQALRAAFTETGDQYIPGVLVEEAKVPAPESVPADSAVTALKEIAENPSHPLLGALATRLAEQIKGAVRFLRRPDTTATGTYNAKTRTIEVGGAASHGTVLHEAAHAATAEKIDYGMTNPDSVHGKLVSELEQVRAQAEAAYKGSDSNTKYLLSNLHEFVAGLYGGPSAFMDHLSSLKANTGSLLSRAVDLVRNLLGIPENSSTAFLKALGLSDNLIDTPIAGESSRVFNSPAFRDEGIVSVSAQEWAERLDNFDEAPQTEAIAKQRERARKRANRIWQKLPGMKQFHRLVDSVGFKLGQSKSARVRKLAGILAEDATGTNRISGTTVAVMRDRLADSFKYPFMEVYQRLVHKQMDRVTQLKAAAGGAQAWYQKLADDVAVERLKHRAAVQAGRTYVSSAPAHIQELAKALDGFWRTIAETGTAAGDPIAEGIKGMGWVGHMPYRWDWKFIQHAYVNDIPKYNALRENMRQQYMVKVVNPAIQKMLDAGPVRPEDIANLRVALAPKVERLVTNYINAVMKSPESRIRFQDDRFRAIAEGLLKENWAGTKVTDAMAEEFGKRLQDTIGDRARTEFDLLSEVNGTRLLDFMDTDIARMVEGGSGSAGARIALHRRGLGTPAAREGALDAARMDGATSEELDSLDFLFRSITGDLDNKEHAVLKLLKQGTYASFMGKLGINALADLPASIAHVGVSGFFRMLGKGASNAFSKNNAELVRFLNTHAGSVMGLDYRLHFTEQPESRVSPDTFYAHGSTFRRFASNATDAVGWLSSMRLISRMQHNIFAPFLADEIFNAIKGGKGITAQRLADMGILPKDVARIRAQIMKYDANRKEGGWINMDKWDDQYAADVFIDSIHRAVHQVLQRGYVGEAPRWVSETAIGAVVSQFRGFGLIAAEKLFARNLFIHDSNAAAAFVASTAWGTLLYYARLKANTVNMSPDQADEYMRKHLSGVELATGIGVMVNMSGLLPDILDFGNLFFSGQTYSGSGPVAAAGFIEDLGKAASSLGQVGYGAVTGHKPGSTDPVDYHKRLRDMWRVLPGANTVFGTALSNSLNTPN